MHRTFPVGPTLVLLLAAAGCGEAGVGPEPESGIPVPLPDLRPSDGLLADPELQEVADLALVRDEAGVAARFAHDDPRVRARAAFHLASFPEGARDPAVDSMLGELLADPAPEVRRDAAFALGRRAPPGVGGPLLAALGREEDAAVRTRLLEALGMAADEESLARLVAAGPAGEERGWTEALARAALRGALPAEGARALLARVDHPDPEIRLLAAYPFGRAADREPGREELVRLREALDRADPADPAAMYLVLALGRGEDRRDAGRLVRWLGEAGDWRIRANAARALGATSWLESPGVRDALLDALADPSRHVGVAAARALGAGFRVPSGVLDRMESLLASDTVDWRLQAPLLGPVVEFRSADPVLAWTRRMAAAHPPAVVHGLRALTGIPGSDITALVDEMATHRDPRVRTAAFAALAERWFLEARTEDEMLAFFRRFAEEVERGPPAAAGHAARALAHDAFESAGAPAIVVGAYRRRLEAGEEVAARALLGALAEMGVDPDSLPPLPPPGAGGDGVRWSFLAGLGPAPRLRFVTERGEIVVRMAAEMAPLTVQALARQAVEGRHDGVVVHRVEPNFVFQAGDFSMGDGTGGPGYRLRTELTWIPFLRGAVGMASAGRDTEGSQYFITHSRQLHLDAGFTAFGWVESGAHVLDLVLEGDRIVSVALEPDPEG